MGVIACSKIMMRCLFCTFCFFLLAPWTSEQSIGCLALKLQAIKSHGIRKQLSLICTKVAILSSALSIVHVSPTYASNLENGAALFTTSCSGCHAGGGNILARGKSLFTKDLVKNGYDNAEVMTAYILKGKGQMPAYGSFISPKGNVMPAKYTTEQVMDISDYVLDQAASNWVVAK